MARTDQYQRIFDELAAGELDELQVKVFHFLRRTYPAPLTRRDLIECIYGYRPADGEDLNNNSEDRKIRTAIAGMFDLDIPVVSTSGGAGYRIDIDKESWDELVAEIEAKKETYQRKLDAARRIVAKIQNVGINAIPTTVSDVSDRLSEQADNKPAVRQLSFMEAGA